MMAVQLILATAFTSWPTTQAVTVDLSSPESALISYVDAIEQGDFTAYEKIIAPQTDDERRALHEAAMTNLAAQRLLSTTKKRLGDGAAAKVQEVNGAIGLGPSKESAEALREAMQGAIWNVTGDEALLGEINPEIRFKRINGEWHLLVPLEEHEAELAKQFEHARELRDAIDQITRRVDAGELTTADEIGNAVARLMPVAMASDVTTQPTTGPARR